MHFLLAVVVSSWIQLKRNPQTRKFLLQHGKIPTKLLTNPPTERPKQKNNWHKSVSAKPNRISKVLRYYYRQQTIIIPSNVRACQMFSCFHSCLLSSYKMLSLPRSSVKCISVFNAIFYTFNFQYYVLHAFPKWLNKKRVANRNNISNSNIKSGADAM